MFCGAVANWMNIDPFLFLSQLCLWTRLLHHVLLESSRSCSSETPSLSWKCLPESILYGVTLRYLLTDALAVWNTPQNFLSGLTSNVGECKRQSRLQPSPSRSSAAMLTRYSESSKTREFTSYHLLLVHRPFFVTKWDIGASFSNSSTCAGKSVGQPNTTPLSPRRLPVVALKGPISIYAPLNSQNDLSKHGSGTWTSKLCNVNII